MCDGSVTRRDRHERRSRIGRGGPSVAAGGTDRPVTSVTGVTAGGSARRSIATVLADDLVQELAGHRPPAAAAEATVGAGGAVPDSVSVDAVAVADAQVVPLTPRSPEDEPLTPDTVEIGRASCRERV